MSFNKYAKDRGASKTSLHGLRHAFAKIWYENDGDVVQLSKVLGHSTLHMSQHYMNAYADSKKDLLNVIRSKLYQEEREMQ